MQDGDKVFLRQAMRKLGIKVVVIDWSQSAKKWPDIWCFPNEVPPRIVVTREWARQKPAERHKRVTHELCHILGLEHGIIGGMVFHTKPEKDEYSRYVYNMLRRN